MTLEEKRKKIKDYYGFDIFDLPFHKFPRQNLINWVEGLESGEFVQGNSSLLRKIHNLGNKKFRTSYCCLGVYCKVNGVCHDDHMDNVDFIGDLQPLPESELIEITADLFHDHEIGNDFDTLENILAQLNDGVAYSIELTFKEIAECIKRSSYAKPSN